MQSLKVFFSCFFSGFDSTHSCHSLHSVHSFHSVSFTACRFGGFFSGTFSSETASTNKLWEQTSGHRSLRLFCGWKLVVAKYPWNPSDKLMLHKNDAIRKKQTTHLPTHICHRLCWPKPAIHVSWLSLCLFVEAYPCRAWIAVTPWCCCDNNGAL